MNGPQHYAEAERLVATTRRYYNGGQTVRDEAPPAEDIARAQVHATLALAAATATDYFGSANNPFGGDVR